jgi:hypothetical protein
MCTTAQEWQVANLPAAWFQPDSMELVMKGPNNGTEMGDYHTDVNIEHQWQEMRKHETISN